MRASLLLQRARERLGDSPSPRLDAEVLLCHVLRKQRSWLLAHGEDLLPKDIQDAFNGLIERRSGGEPVAYLIGMREFWSLPIGVSPAVLIPRPETELLVELALGALPPAGPVRIADLGTGSGAIALALATERPEALVVAVEQSGPALEVARANAERLGLGADRVEFRHGDWFELLEAERFHCLVCNPPYVRENDPHLQQGDVRFEPREALAAGPEGLDAIRRVISEAPIHLNENGLLFLEHGHDQQPAIIAEIKERFPNANVEPHADDAGVPRAVVVSYQ